MTFPTTSLPSTFSGLQNLCEGGASAVLDSLKNPAPPTPHTDGGLCTPPSGTSRWTAALWAAIHHFAERHIACSTIQWLKSVHTTMIVTLLAMIIYTTFLFGMAWRSIQRLADLQEKFDQLECTLPLVVGKPLAPHQSPSPTACF